jgi:excisionase family DNA binding protein
MNISNPFEDILNRLETIENKLDGLNAAQVLAELPRALNAQQAADFLNLKRGTIHRLTHEKAIPFYKRGGRLYFDRLELEKWLLHHKQA